MYTYTQLLSLASKNNNDNLGSAEVVKLYECCTQRPTTINSGTGTHASDLYSQVKNPASHMEE